MSRAVTDPSSQIRKMYNFKAIPPNSFSLRRGISKATYLSTVRKNKVHLEAVAVMTNTDLVVTYNVLGESLINIMLTPPSTQWRLIQRGSPTRPIIRSAIARFNTRLLETIRNSVRGFLYKVTITRRFPTIVIMEIIVITSGKSPLNFSSWFVGGRVSLSSAILLCWCWICLMRKINQVELSLMKIIKKNLMNRQSSFIAGGGRIWSCHKEICPIQPTRLCSIPIISSNPPPPPPHFRWSWKKNQS